MATKRAMKSYNITDVEIDSLGLAQGISAVCFAIGTGFLTTCIDIKKDVMLSAQATPVSIALDFSVMTFGFPVAVVFYLVGIATFLYTNSVVKRIKRESEQI